MGSYQNNSNSPPEKKIPKEVEVAENPFLIGLRKKLTILFLNYTRLKFLGR